MANPDNAKGFYPVGHLNGGEIRTLPLKLGGTVYKGDLVSAGVAGTVTAAVADDVAIVCGVASEYGESGSVIGIWADPDIIFGVQKSVASTIADVFSGMNHTAGAGNAKTKLSGHYLAGAGAQCQIIGLVETPDNAWGTNQDVKVLITEHAFILRAAITS